ncbi:MAG: HEAT repeat domain-containing protein [Methanomicrobiaceae archaeon]|nr:HEAT repeat domain-containing protein [Methanomicrobiaceae archaeon]
MAVSFPEIFQYKRFRSIILIALLILATFLEIFIHLYGRNPTGFTHLYIFIVMLAILYTWKATGYGIYLAVLHVLIQYLIAGTIDPSTTFRAVMFIVVAFLLGVILEHIEQEHGDMIAYLLERALRDRRQMKGDEIGEISPRSIAGTTIPLLKERGDVRGLIFALQHPDVEARYRAAIALGELGDPGAVEALARALEDENSGVRWEAAEALGKIGKPATGVLIEALGRDDDDIRWRAAIALGEIGDESVVDPLVRSLSDPDPYVRSRMVRALAKIGAPAIDSLIKAAWEGEPFVKDCALAALAGMDREGLQELREKIAQFKEEKRALFEEILKEREERGTEE